MTEDKARPWGEWLKQRREELGISLDQAEEETRIRRRYLEAMEAGNLEALPDPAVGRGFLRNYASYLELDAQEASARFPDVFAKPGSDPIPIDDSSPFVAEPFRPVALHAAQTGRSRRWFLVGAVVILVVALALLGWWAYPRVAAWLALDGDSRTNSPTAGTPAQETANSVLSTATRTPTATTAPTFTAPATEPVTTAPTLELTVTPSTTPTPPPSPSPSPQIYTGIFLELVFTDTSWIQVTVDGVRQFQGELELGTYRSWYGEERIELRIGNAGAVQVTVNGEFLGALGASGEVVDRVFEKVEQGVTEATITPVTTGEATATAIPTDTSAPPAATPTVTPPASTATATATVTPTGTLTPTTSP